MAHIRQSRLSSGLGSQVNFRAKASVLPCSLGSGWRGTRSNQAYLGIVGWRCQGEARRFGFRASGFGRWASGVRFRVSGFGFRASGSGFRDSGFSFRVSGFGFQVLGFGFQVSGSGFRDRGPGFRLPNFGRAIGTEVREESRRASDWRIFYEKEIK